MQPLPGYFAVPTFVFGMVLRLRFPIFVFKYV